MQALMSTPLGNRVKKRREALGLSQKDLAERVGMSQQGIDSIENKDVARPRKLLELAAALRVSVEWLADGSGEPPLEPERLVEEAGEPGRIVPERNVSAPFDIPRSSGRRIPILGQSRGGEEGIFLFNGEAVDWIVAPHALENVPGAYGVFVSGDSMEPRYMPGETLLVRPHKPISRGDFVVVQMRGRDETVPHGFVKQFVTWTPTRLILRQYNPAKEIEIERGDVVSVHKIVGTQNGI